MDKTPETYAKILFRYESPVLDEWIVETMWARVINAEKGLYKIDNIPFYGPLVASGDIVYAEYDDDEEMLTYRKTIEYSGNSIVAVIIMQKHVEINPLRDVFKEMGCLSEKVNDFYFVMEILAENDYTPVKQKLTEFREQGILDFSEPCLSDRHIS